MKVTPLPDVDARRLRLAASRSARSTACTSATARSSAAATPCSPSTRTRSSVHPARRRAPKLIDPFAVKRDLIAGLGVEELVVIPFDREFASSEAEDSSTRC